MKLHTRLAALLGRLWPFAWRSTAELLELSIDIHENEIRRQRELVLDLMEVIRRGRRENNHLYDLLHEADRIADIQADRIEQLRNPPPVDFAYPLPYWLSAVIIVDQRETTATVEGTAGWPGSDLSRPFGLG